MLRGGDKLSLSELIHGGWQPTTSSFLRCEDKEYRKLKSLLHRFYAKERQAKYRLSNLLCYHFRFFQRNQTARIVEIAR